MKISAIIPAFNAERTIARALHSVLAQTRAADEILVIDDGSTDNTAGAVRAFGDRVRLITQANAGVSVARNTGIRAAGGDWIAFLDADDEWLPEKLELQTKLLANNPELKWAYANFFIADSARQTTSEAHAGKEIAESMGPHAYVPDYLPAEIKGAYVWTGTVLACRSVFEKVGYFEPGMKRAQDVDLWYRIAYAYPAAGYSPKCLAVYHMDTPGSSTKVNDRVEFMIGLVNRHLALSKTYGRDEVFRPCITHMVEDWIRQLLRAGRYSDIRILMEQFSEYLPARFQREIRCRLFCPPVFSPLAESVHWIKRTLLK